MTEKKQSFFRKMFTDEEWERIKDKPLFWIPPYIPLEVTPLDKDYKPAFSIIETECVDCHHRKMRDIMKWDAECGLHGAACDNCKTGELRVVRKF